MIKLPLFILIILGLTIFCDSDMLKVKRFEQQVIIETQRKSTVVNTFKTNEVIIDTNYVNTDYNITLSVLDLLNENELAPNVLFTFSKLKNGKYMPLFTDSIFSSIKDIHFADFNNDKIKDILIQHTSDVRSNMTYNLYLVDTTQNKLKKIKGFEHIKNPNYLSEHNLISNYVMSGQIWTSFYKISADSILSFDILIYDNQTEDGSYELDFERAIKSLLKEVHNNN